MGQQPSEALVETGGGSFDLADDRRQPIFAIRFAGMTTKAPKITLDDLIECLNAMVQHLMKGVEQEVPEDALDCAHSLMLEYLGDGDLMHKFLLLAILTGAPRDCEAIEDVLHRIGSMRVSNAYAQLRCLYDQARWPAMIN
jgi:hypothetical protein